MSRSKPLPWWLDGGTETCELCEHPHALQSQRRCAACDRASCEHCVTVNRQTGEVLCHECAAEQRQEGGR
jgi:hypothetical protein